MEIGLMSMIRKNPKIAIGMTRIWIFCLFLKLRTISSLVIDSKFYSHIEVDQDTPHNNF